MDGFVIVEVGGGRYRSSAKWWSPYRVRCSIVLYCHRTCVERGDGERISDRREVVCQGMYGLLISLIYGDNT